MYGGLGISSVGWKKTLRKSGSDTVYHVNQLNQVEIGLKKNPV